MKPKFDARDFMINVVADVLSWGTAGRTPIQTAERGARYAERKAAELMEVGEAVKEPISIYPVGTRVEFVDRTIRGFVTRVEISIGDQVRYEVAYWFESKQVTLWAYAFELEVFTPNEPTWLHPIR